MQYDFSMQMPTNFDVIHLGLLSLSLMLLLILLLRKNSEVRVSTTMSAGDREVSETKLAGVDEAGALQLLSLLQKDGRLVDFVQEDISSFSDEDVGAAARVVHKGLRQAFDDYFTIETIRSEAEGDQVQVNVEQQHQKIQLIGPLNGQHEVHGILIHQGWYIAQVHLPQMVTSRDHRIIAPAQIEVVSSK